MVWKNFFKFPPPSSQSLPNKQKCCSISIATYHITLESWLDVDTQTHIHTKRDEKKILSVLSKLPDAPQPTNCDYTASTISITPVELPVIVYRHLGTQQLVVVVVVVVSRESCAQHRNTICCRMAVVLSVCLCVYGCEM